ncbi:MAG: chromate resistance protein ChrB domain-containing protein [Betaproteobacteria bacterium]
MDTARPHPHSTSHPFAPPELYRLLGGNACPLVVDVRKAAAFDSDPQMLPGAARVAPEHIGAWDPTHARPVVTYCVHGHEVSQGAASALRARGFHATHLEGGIELWRELGMPLLRKAPSLNVPSATPSRWVTRERPKIDRIACPWLVRRFVDPAAQFLYVPTAEVFETAAAAHAIAYDIPGAPLEHDGDRCSFDAFLKAFDLHDRALDDLAAIVRGADTGKPELTPQSAGLLAISVGLSNNFPDDHAMLAHGMIVYDALYAWCRYARDEKHNWAPATMSA